MPTRLLRTTRNIDGEKYHNQAFHHLKSEAQEHAERLRRHGDNARVIKVRDCRDGWGNYAVFARKKK